MFFIVSKLLAFLLNPIIWVVVLLLFSFFKKEEKIKKRLFKIALIILLVFSNPFIYDECMRLWEVEAVSANNLPVYDIGIVLGTTSGYDKTIDRIQFFYTADRLFQAIELYKRGKIKKILYSGGSGSLLHPDEKEGIYIKRYLITLGIPEADIIMEYESRNTFENATFSKKLIPYNTNKILLITSASHMRRAFACFNKQGIKVDAYSTHRNSGPRKFEPAHLVIPRAYVLNSWYDLLHELFGYIVYKAKGYS